MIIKLFREFVNEKYKIEPDDSVNVVIDKHTLNAQEEFVREWPNNKQKIRNFFLSKKRTTEQEVMDMIDFFFKKKWIEKKTKELNKLKFRNEYSLLNDWCKICKLQIELKDLEAVIKGNQTDIQNSEQNAEENTGETVAKDSETKIAQSQERLKKNKDEIAKKRKEILDLDKRVRKDFELYVKRTKEAKKRMELRQKEIKSTPADMDENQEK